MGLCNITMDTKLKGHNILNPFYINHLDIFIHLQYKSYSCIISIHQHKINKSIVKDNLYMGMDIEYKFMRMIDMFLLDKWKNMILNMTKDYFDTSCKRSEWMYIKDKVINKASKF